MRSATFPGTFEIRSVSRILLRVREDENLRRCNGAKEAPPLSVQFLPEIQGLTTPPPRPATPPHLENS